MHEAVGVFFLAILGKSCNFAPAFERQKAVREKSIAILSFSPNSPKFKQEDEHQCYRLYVYAICISIPSDVRDVPKDPVPVKAFGDAW